MMRTAPPRLTQAVTVPSGSGIDADTSEVPPSTVPITAAPANHLLIVRSSLLPSALVGPDAAAAIVRGGRRSGIRGSPMLRPRRGLGAHSGGGTGGIRTPGPCGPPAFKAGAFVRSATVPGGE